VITVFLLISFRLSSLVVLIQFDSIAFSDVLTTLLRSPCPPFSGPNHSSSSLLRPPDSLEVFSPLLGSRFSQPVVSAIVLLLLPSLTFCPPRPLEIHIFPSGFFLPLSPPTVSYHSFLSFSFRFLPPHSSQALGSVLPPIAQLNG